MGSEFLSNFWADPAGILVAGDRLFLRWRWLALFFDLDKDLPASIDELVLNWRIVRQILKSAKFISGFFSFFKDRFALLIDLGLSLDRSSLPVGFFRFHILN